MAKMERQLLQDFAKLVIHLWLLVDIASDVETKHLEIAVEDIGKGIQMDDPQLRMTPIVLDCIFLVYAHGWKMWKRLTQG